MSTGTKTKTTGLPKWGPFETEVAAKEYAAKFDGSSFITVLSIDREDDGWLITFVEAFTTTFPHDVKEGWRMKRFLLFTGVDYGDTENGWDGFQGDFSTVEAARAARDKAPLQYHDWFHIVDITIKAKIEYGRKRAGKWSPTRPPERARENA